MAVPKLRFKEFESKWKSQSLLSFADRVVRKNKKNTCQLPLTISAQYGLVDQTEFFNKTVASKNLEGYYLLENGEFAYNKSYSNGYPFGAIKRLDRYKMGVLSTLYICFKPKANTDSNFLTHYFETNKWHNEVSMIAVEGARNHGLLNIPIADFFDTQHSLPSEIQEQKKIADFLSLLDRKIALQEKKIALLKDYKRGVLESIIKTEKLGTWVNVKLSEVLYERKEYSLKGGDYIHCSLTQQGVVDKTERYERDFLVRDEEKNYKITRLNDICYNPANLKFGVICRNTYGEAIFSPIYITFETSKICNPIYIGYYLSRWNFINAVRRYEEGTVYERMAVKPSDLLNFEISLPDIDTQKKVADLLQQIENKELLYVDKLSEVKKLKQALLQQMFI